MVDAFLFTDCIHSGVVADVLGRIVGYPNEISVGIMIALIGGPFFVFLVKRWKISLL